MRHILTVIVVFTSITLFAQKNMELRSQLTYGKRLNDIWGYVDSSGNEYALVGVYNGVSIVDVSDPDSISEVAFINGINSTWRDLKTWKDYAFVTNESGDGLMIIDLHFLPDTVFFNNWTADTLFGKAHNIFIDENGVAYLFGYNNTSGTVNTDDRGALIADVDSTPMNPVVIGAYNDEYVHDGFVRGDTMWTSEIFRGQFGVVDVSDKANPIVLATQETPSRFTHNCWLSDDGNTLFTTDEKSAGFVGSYDVSMLENIEELDRYQVAPGSGLIPHNTYALGNYLVTSYYKYGVTVTDATRPDNLVEVGFYDTSPFPSSDGFAGCWGVYPYLPSGTILATDIQTGLFVFTPTFTRACYLEGNVTDENSGMPLSDIRVEIMTTNSQKFTDILGDYKTGAADSGRYDVRFFKNGCIPKIITGVDLHSGLVTVLNTTVNCTTLVSSLLDKETLENQLTAYPTVFNQSTTIAYNLNPDFSAEDLVIAIYNTSGQNIFSYSLNSYQGEIEFGQTIGQGLYIVRLAYPGGALTLKLIKQ